VKWRTLDLFCGAAGGWTLGLHRAGFLTVAACEIDSWRRAVFGRNNPSVLLYDDVRTLDADRLLRDLGFLPEIICGSPPCQDASTANVKGRGVDGERTGLFFEAVRLVREVRPRWVLLENVPGLRTRGYDRVHDALEEAGYAVWPLVVGAVHAGAPHLRKRVWIVALAKSAQEQMGRTGFAWAEAERISPVTAPLHGLEIARREPDGNRTAPHAYAESIGRRQAKLEFVEERRPNIAQTVTAHASQPVAIGRREDRRRFGRQEENARAFADADKARRTRGRMELGLRQAQEPEHRRSILEAWTGWNGGPPEIGRVDDGLSEALASRRGIGRACLAAYGDAVLPQITEAIGRTIKSFDRGDF
jgi:DNA (cytosine-5)-methyltransferase 1